MRIPVYEEGKLYGLLLPHAVERLLTRRRAHVVRSRRGEIKRVYLLGDSEHILTPATYSGSKYSHNRESNHPNLLYQNIRGVWAFRYISPKARDMFFAVIRSCMCVVVLAFLLGFKPHELPPDPRNVTAVGCEVRQVTIEGDAFYGWWRLYTWADRSGVDRWRRLHSVREKRWQALRDCDRWLEAMRKSREKR
jgi:hypothetical protein